MREYLYKVNDPMGFHARPASQIFMEARKYNCSIEAVCKGQSADAKRLLDLMGLGVRKDSQILFRFDGVDESKAEKAVKEVLSHL